MCARPNAVPPSENLAGRPASAAIGTHLRVGLMKPLPNATSGRQQSQ